MAVNQERAGAAAGGGAMSSSLHVGNLLRSRFLGSRQPADFKIAVAMELSLKPLCDFPKFQRNPRQE